MPASEPAGEPACTDSHGAEGSSRIAQPEMDLPEIGLGENDIARRLRIVGLHRRQFTTQYPRVVRDRLHRPAVGAPTGRLRVVVAVTRHPVHLQWRVLGKEFECLGPAIEIGVDQLGIDFGSDDAQQVLPCRGDIVGRRLAVQDGIARNPDPATRAGRRSAPSARLLHEKYRPAMVGGGDRGRHPRGSGADDDHIDCLRDILVRHVDGLLFFDIVVRCGPQCRAPRQRSSSTASSAASTQTGREAVGLSALRNHCKYPYSAAASIR